ncbi:putative repeat protein (TIGR02543 family) [Paenibacillus sp. DS2015]|uniref:InlB B-repeat-containing protein n=1 Tax=Paenibacillus sp. DS2015 TaxID=3373917 RepID=UPI003D2443E3
MGVNDITHIRYSVNGNPFTKMSYVPSFILGIGNVDGEKVLTFKLVDGAGNESPEYQRTITLDTVAPTGTVVINNGIAYTTNPDVTLNLSLGSGVTDVVGVQFSNNNSSWSVVEAFSSTKSYTLSAGNGNKTVYVRLFDRAGNKTEIQSSILLDTTEPTGTVVVNDGRAYTNNSNVYVDITPAAGVTDIAYIKYTVIGSPSWMIPYNSSFLLDIGSRDGAKAVMIQLIDGAGNESPEYNSTITLDTVKPTGTVVINSGTAYTTSQDVTLNFTLGAGVTDVDSVQFSYDDLKWSDEKKYRASMNYTLRPGDGSKTVYVRFIDHAGNSGSAQASIILDMTAPIVIGVKDGESYDSLLTITFYEGTATLNGSSFISGSSVDAEDSYVLVVTDDAGNSITITFNILKYRVSYDGNGATGGLVPIDSQPYEIGNSVTVADNTGSLVKTGFTFNGWNTKVDGSGTSYAANDTFNISAANVILYAAWDINQYTLSFESNGGSVVAPQNKSYNETATEPTAPTKQGYSFGGWYKEITLAKQWIFTKDLVTANTTLYVKWIDNSSSGSNGGGYIPTVPQNSTMYFETNGGNVVVNLSVANDSRLAELPTPTKEGFIFGGWYQDVALTQKWDLLTDRVTKDTKLYAKWIANTSPAPKPGQEPEPTPDGPKSELPVVTFEDISGHWAKGMIEELASQGIITGYPDGSFHPDESIQRQHMALIFMRAFEFEATREPVSFSDVSPSHPY